MKNRVLSKKKIADQYYNLVRGKGKKLDPRMVDVIICDYMKWDYWTYVKQPSWFIDLLIIKMRIDSAINK